MERPGFLELAVYALVLTAAAAWVYALPPFTHDPAGFQSAESQAGEIQSVAATSPGASGSDQSETAAGDSSQDSAAAAVPPVTERQSATAAEPDPQPNLLIVTARSLNMRSAPDAGSDLVGNYPRGALVKPVETSGNWVLVRTVDDGSTGWMYAGYLGAAENN